MTIKVIALVLSFIMVGFDPAVQTPKQTQSVESANPIFVTPAEHGKWQILPDEGEKPGSLNFRAMLVSNELDNAFLAFDSTKPLHGDVSMDFRFGDSQKGLWRMSESDFNTYVVLKFPDGTNYVFCNVIDTDDWTVQITSEWKHSDCRNISAYPDMAAAVKSAAPSSVALPQTVIDKLQTNKQLRVWYKDQKPGTGHWVTFDLAGLKPILDSLCEDGTAKYGYKCVLQDDTQPMEQLVKPK